MGTLRVNWVSRLVAVTSAPGTAAPDASVTTPRMVPVEPWAPAGVAARQKTNAIPAHLCKVINILWGPNIDAVLWGGQKLAVTDRN